ncbi:MAG: hypothetical protein ACAI18_04710 [Gemmatimonadales bacterium]
MTARPLLLLMGALSMGLLLFAAFVWPTPYQSEFMPGYDPAVLKRTNRFTGEIELRGRNITLYVRTNSATGKVESRNSNTAPWVETEGEAIVARILLAGE